MFGTGKKIKINTPDSRIFYQNQRRFWIKMAALAIGIIVVVCIIVGTMSLAFGTTPKATGTITPDLSVSPDVSQSSSPEISSTELPTTTTPISNSPKPTFSREPNATTTGKIVYLTFDDGPSANTPSILDTLKSKNIHATFFSIGYNIESHTAYFNRIYEEGNVIGCHTFSHVINKPGEPYSIYGSPTNLADEINQWDAAATKALGHSLPYKLFRFPGGSSYSAVRSNYSAFMDTVHHMGYKAFDWNVVSDDSIVMKPTVEYLKEHFTASFTAYEKGYSKYPCIILMHDAVNKEATAEVLPWIIDYISAKGYQFGTLDQLQSEYLH